MVDFDEKIERIEKLALMLNENVETAILSHTVSEAINLVVPPGMFGIDCLFIDSYQANQNALALKLSIDLARIFDVSASRKRLAQDKASIQILQAFLQEAGIEDQLLARPRPVPILSGKLNRAMVAAFGKKFCDQRDFPDFNERKAALESFRDLGSKFDIENSYHRTVLLRVRKFRDYRLAHSIFNKDAEGPTFGDLECLLELAKQAVTLAFLAIFGLRLDYEELAEMYRKEANGYAACLLDGLRRAAADTELSQAAEI